jgi:hypothetical protein
MKLPSVLAYLGSVLDLRIEESGSYQVLTWPRHSMWLCADASRRRLYIVPRPRARRRKLTDKVAAGAEVFRSWADFEPVGFSPSTVTVSQPVRRGRVKHIAYRSEKWSGKAEDYQHDCGAGISLRQAGEVYVISGGDLSVTPTGIQG